MLYATWSKSSFSTYIALLEKTKNEILEIPEGHICCGSAGTYNILQSEIA